VSSGTAYSYQYVDVAAQERRRVRAEIAELGARAAIAHARADSHSAALARQLGLGKLSLATGSKDNAALAAQASELRQAVTAAERALDQMVADSWAVRSPKKGRGVASTTAAEEFARNSPVGQQPGGSTRAPGVLPPTAYTARGDEAIGRSAATAETLLAAEAHRCAPDDLRELDGLVTQVWSADSAGEARRLRTELESAVRASIDSRKRAEAVAVARARLLARAEDALPEDRDNLAAVIKATPDPDGVSGLVDAAVARADRIRQREAVAQAAAAALADIGADVGEDFVTMLTARGETAVPLGPGWAGGYGLLVSLPTDKTELSTVLVRHPDAATDQDHDKQEARDLAAQQLFCDTKLGPFQARVGQHGVRFYRTFQTEPGNPSVRPAPSEAWSRPPVRETVNVEGRAKRPASRVTPAAARERSRER
jgi:hypothetical protein